MSVNYGTNSRDILTLDDDLNQSFYEADENGNVEENKEYEFNETSEENRQLKVKLN